MPCYRCGVREADPARGSRLWVRAVRADIQVLVCPECQESASWSSDVDHCSTCHGTNLVRRLGQTVCRTCESSATAEFLAVESTTDRGIAVGSGGRHRRSDDDGRDLSAEVATAIDRVLGKHAKRPAEDEQPMYPPEDDDDAVAAPAAGPARQSVPGPQQQPEQQPEPAPAGPPRDDGGGDGRERAGRFGRGRRR